MYRSVRLAFSLAAALLADFLSILKEIVLVLAPNETPRHIF